MLLAVAVGRSFCDGLAIYYEFPVSRMTSYFIPWSQRAASSTTLCLEQFARWRYQFDIRRLQCLVEFVRMRHRVEDCYLRFTYFPSNNTVLHCIKCWHLKGCQRSITFIKLAPRSYALDFSRATHIRALILSKSVSGLNFLICTQAGKAKWFLLAFQTRSLTLFKAWVCDDN